MNCRRDIQIIDLLKLRESEFVTVWDCEQLIGRILGAPYPLPPPPELPSQRRAPKPKKQTAQAEYPPKLRRLKSDGENVYRIVYRLRDEEHVSLQTDAALVRAAMQCDVPGLCFMRIETAWQGEGSCEICELLWKR